MSLPRAIRKSRQTQDDVPARTTVELDAAPDGRERRDLAGRDETIQAASLADTLSIGSGANRTLDPGEPSAPTSATLSSAADSTPGELFGAESSWSGAQAQSALPWQLAQASTAATPPGGSNAGPSEAGSFGLGLGLSLFGGSLIALAARSNSTTVATPVTIKVIDGYVAGAKIYIDANRNGTAEDNELVAGVLTDANGAFTLPSMPTAPIIAVGGTNTDTGLPNVMPILAPEGARVLTPLTTVAQYLILDGHVTTADEAAAKVLSALGLDLPGDRASMLYSYDPVARNDATVHRAGVAIATLFDIGGNGDRVIGFHAVKELAQMIVTAANSAPGTTVDLYSSSTVEAVLGQVVTKPSVLSAASAAVAQIASARDIATIAAAQKQQLESPSPATPSFDVSEVFLTNRPSGSVTLNPPSDGADRAAAAGDTLKLMLYRGDLLLGEREQILEPDDISARSVAIKPPAALDDGIYRVTAQIITPRGRVSALSEDIFTVDAIAAKAIDVTLDAGGKSLRSLLPKGTKLTASVVFDSAITIKGAPSLRLQIDGEAVEAELDAASSTSTVLRFTYNLLKDARDVAIPANALKAESKVITDERGRDATLATEPVFPNGLSIKLDGEVLVSPTALDIGTEPGDYKTFQAVLGGKPKSEVTLTLQSGDGSEVALSTDTANKAKSGAIVTLHFTPDNWNVAQNFKVLLVDDKLNDTPEFIPIFASSRSHDPVFNNLTLQEGPMASAFAVHGLPMEEASLITTLNGEAFVATASTISLLPAGNQPASPKTLAIALSRAPIADVTLVIGGEGDDFTIDGLTPKATHVLEFNAHNWNRSQAVVLEPASVAGLLKNNPDSVEITILSADSAFNQLKLTIAIDAADPVSGGSGPNEKFGGAPQSVVEIITTAITQFVDQVASETLPLVGQAGSAFIDGLTTALFEGNSIDFVFNQSNNTFKLKIDKNLPVFQVPLASDLGFAIGDPASPIIGFDLDAEVNVTVGARLMLEGQIDTLALEQGRLGSALILRPFDAGASNSSADDAGSQLLLDLTLAVPGQMKGSLWPFAITATDQKAVNEALMRDVGTGMRGQVAISLIDNNSAPGVSVGELFSTPQSTIDLSADWKGQISAKVEGELKTGVDFFDFFLPALSFDLGIPFLSAETSNAEQRLRALESRRDALIKTYPGIESAATIALSNLSGSWLTKFLPSTAATPASAIDELTSLNKQIPLLKAEIAQSGSGATNTAVGKVLLDNITLDLGEVFEYVTPVLQVLDPVLQTIRPVIDILTQDLLEALTVTPYTFNQDEWGFWDYVFAPIKVAREGVKALASSALADLITNTLKSMDGSTGHKPDGKVNVLEVLSGGAKLAKNLPGITSQQSEALDSIADLVATVDKILDYFNLYYSVSDRMRAPNGLIALDQGINLGSLVISKGGVEQPTLATGGETPGAGGSAAAPASNDWVAVPPAGQKTLPSLIDLLGDLSPEAVALVEDLGELGISFPLLNDPALIGKVLMLQPIDLMEFRPKIPHLAAEISLPLGDVLDMVANSILPGLSTTLTAVRSLKLPGAQPVKLEAPLSIDAGISLESRLAIGLDTAGIIDWVRKGARFDLAGAASLLDGVYLSDNLVNGVDLPELSGEFNVDLLLKLLVGGRDYGLLLSGKAGAGLHGGYELDLEDGGEQLGQSDGKIRPSEIVAGLLDPGPDGELDFWDVAGSLLPGGGLYDFDMYGSGKVDLSAGFELDLANSVIRKNINQLGSLLGFLPGVGLVVNAIVTFASDVLATVPKIELELAATNSFPIFDTRGGQPVLFA